MYEELINSCLIGLKDLYSIAKEGRRSMGCKWAAGLAVTYRRC